LENSKTGFALKKKEMPSYLKIRTSREKKDGFFSPYLEYCAVLCFEKGNRER